MPTVSVLVKLENLRCDTGGDTHQASNHRVQLTRSSQHKVDGHCKNQLSGTIVKTSLDLPRVLRGKRLSFANAIIQILSYS